MVDVVGGHKKYLCKRTNGMFQNFFGIIITVINRHISGTVTELCICRKMISHKINNSINPFGYQTMTKCIFCAIIIFEKFGEKIKLVIQIINSAELLCFSLFSTQFFL